MIKYIKYIIPVIMVIFFARNIYLSEKMKLDSWMGGGMRMFAEIDKSLHRVVFLEVNQNDGKIKYINLNNVKQVEDEVMSMRVLPNKKKSAKIQSRIIEDKRIVDELDLNKDSIATMNIIVNRIDYLPTTKKLKFMEIYRDAKNN